MGRNNERLRFGAVAVATFVAISISVGGCSSDQTHEFRAHTDKVTSGAGDAMASNRAVHTVDPWPYHSQKTQIDIDGKRAQAAVRRYESNTSIKLNGNSNGGQKN